MPKKHSPPKPHSAPKAFDVFKPGKALASPTSRPVIAGHKPAVRDSTVTGKPHKPMAKPRSNGELLDSHDKVTVPLPVAGAAAVQSQSASQPATPTELPTPPAEEKPTQPAVQTETVPEVPTVPSVQIAANDPDAPTNQEPEQGSVMQTEEPAPPAPELPEATPEAVAPDLDGATSDEPIVDPAQIVVSHHKPVGQSKWKGIFLVLSILILAVVSVDVVLDVGIWSPSFSIPHTHFFNH